MKKKVFVVVSIFLIVLIVAGIITNYVDSGRVTTGHEPKYCIKIVSNDGSKVTYWGLGYKVIRYVGISPNEPYENSIGVKMGSWFMKYELVNKQRIVIEHEGKKIDVSNPRDINKIYNILVNSKYDSEECDGIITHKIKIDNEIYYLKEDCSVVQRDDKQSKISKEDLDTILQIVEDNK